MRENLIREMTAVLVESSLVDAIWEGGSKATGRLDAFSDIDLLVLAKASDVAPVFDVLEARLETLYGISDRWMPQGVAFRGLSQRFYRLNESPELFFLDIGVLAPEATELFLEKERHGTPAVYFDPGGRLKPAPFDSTRHAASMAARLTEISESLPFRRALVEKELKRNHPLDALAFYQVMVRMLIELLGMRFRPARFDFGQRYLHYDLPLEEQRELEKFAFVASAEEIQAQLAPLASAIAAWAHDLRRSLP